MNPMATASILAIEIGGTKLQVGCVERDGEFELLQRYQVVADRGAAGICQQIASSFDRLHIPSFAAVGVGFGGPVHWQTGRVATSHHVSGWSGFPLAEWIHERSGLPVHVENDANAAAFAEAMFGAGVGRNPVLYTNSGSGVGAGLVADGRLYRGMPPGELEIGHLRITRGGDTVEDRCSGWVLDRRVRKELGDSGAREMTLNEKGLALLEEIAGDYAFGLSHAVHLLNPAVIVLGGGVSLLGEPWRAAVARQLPAMLMGAMQPGPAVVLAALGEMVVPLGAATLARQRFVNP